MQDLAGLLRVPRADHNVVRPTCSEAVPCPGPAVGQPGQALDAGATEHGAEQLGLGLATGNLYYDPVVRARHLPERERVRLGARLEERDLKRPLADRVALADQLVQAAVPQQPVAVHVHVHAV